MSDPKFDRDGNLIRPVTPIVNHDLKPDEPNMRNDNPNTTRIPTIPVSTATAIRDNSTFPQEDKTNTETIKNIDASEKITPPESQPEPQKKAQKR